MEKKRATFLRGFNLGLQDILQGDGISGKLADTFSQLLHGHGVLVEVESEVGLIINVGLSLNIEGLSGS